MNKPGTVFLLIIGFMLAPLVTRGAFVAIPDLTIGSKLGRQKGDDVNGTGQKVRVRTKPSGKGKFFFVAQNEETVPGDLRVTASRKNKKFKIRYIQISPAAGNVTGAITGPAGLLLPLVPSKGSVSFKAIAKSGRKFKARGVKRTFVVTVLDPTNANLADTGRAKVIKKKNK